VESDTTKATDELIEKIFAEKPEMKKGEKELE
jgi:hypothetical protein